MLVRVQPGEPVFAQVRQRYLAQRTTVGATYVQPRTARSRRSGGYLLDELADTTPTIPRPRSGVSGHPGAIQLTAQIWAGRGLRARRCSVGEGHATHAAVVSVAALVSHGQSWECLERPAMTNVIPGTQLSHSPQVSQKRGNRALRADGRRDLRSARDRMGAIRATRPMSSGDTAGDA